MGFNAIRTDWGALPQEFSQKALRFIPLDLPHNIAEFPPETLFLISLVLPLQKIPVVQFLLVIMLGILTTANSKLVTVYF